MWLANMRLVKLDRGEDKKRILVVDDEPSIVASAKAILKSEGYLVDTAGTGREAIEKSKVHLYDLALLDIRLPDMEGTSLLMEMRMGKPRMRTIMITGYPSLDNTVESLNLGADGYIIKPIDPRKLLEIVREKLWERKVKEFRTIIPKHL